MIRHGIIREVYASPLVSDFKEYLCGEVDQPDLDLHPARDISKAAFHRWVLPRSSSK